MSGGIEDGPFSVTNPAGLDVSVGQNGESVRKLYRPLRKFHGLIKAFSTEYRTQCAWSGHTREWFPLRRNNSHNALAAAEFF